MTGSWYSAAPALSPSSQQGCMPQAVAVPAGRMRDPPPAETYSDAPGPGLLIQSLQLFSSPCNYIALIILIVPIWESSSLGLRAQNCFSFSLRVIKTVFISVLKLAFLAKNN